MIELNNINKVYKSKKSSDTVALKNVNLKFGNTGMVFIVGKSGSGKSTLLNLLGGLDTPDSGSIKIDGNDITKFNKKKYDAYRNTYVGFIFQEFNVLEQFNVFENVELAIKLQNSKMPKYIINRVLKTIGIGDLANRKINELSGGQKQRVAIARAIIKRPKLILADEPTGNLDSESSEQIFNILKELSKEQLIIVVSHDIESAQRYADKIIKIDDGNVYSDSSYIENDGNEQLVLKKSKLPFIYSFKMSLSSILKKPFKLFMTIILTAMSLIFMGVTVNCCLFDKDMFLVNTMVDNEDYLYNVIKQNHHEDNIPGSLYLGDNDVKEIENITNSKVNLTYSLYNNGEFLTFEYGEDDESHSLFPNRPIFSSYTEINDSRILGNIIGREPENDREIVIHKYLADYMINFGVMSTDNNLYFPKNYDDLINSQKKLKLGENEVIVSGIINDDDKLFKEAKKSNSFSSNKLEEYYCSSYANKGNDIYVKGFTETAKLINDKSSLLKVLGIYNSYGSGSEESSYDNNNSLNVDTEVITNNGKQIINCIKKDEIILSLDTLRMFDKEFDTKFNKYLETSINLTYEESLEKFVIDYIGNNKFKLNIRYMTRESGKFNYIDAKLIGVSLDDKNYISNIIIEEYNPVSKTVACSLIYNNNKKNLIKAFKQMDFNEINIFEEPNPENKYAYDLNVDGYDVTLGNIINVYVKLFIYILVVSLVFVLFSFLLFTNFISTSISYCKKEIGILRAIGTSNKDVVKIFTYESILIAIVSWILSIVGWYIICDILNNNIFGAMYYTVNGIVTHPLITIIMFIYTIFIAITISFASIRKVTNIKPIDAINNK